MGVTYVAGRAGCGKTEYILREAVRAARAGEKVLVVTPELMTLGMEQALTRALPVLWNVEVLSPSRLQARVREEKGGEQPVLLDDAGRAMAVRATLSRLQGKLLFFKGQGGSLVERLVELLGELKSGELGSTGLRLAADGLPEGLTRDKLYDLAAILDGYEGFTAGKYMDGEDAADRFCKDAKDSGLLRGAEVFIDGFDVLPLKTCRMFFAMCEVCKHVTLSFKTDSAFGRDQALFDPVQESYECLHRMVLASGLPWNKVELRKGAPRKGALLHLEAELFARPFRPYAETPQEIGLWALRDCEAEAEWAAGALHERMRKAGLKPGEAAVLCQEPETYAAALQRAFDRRGLPLFVDSSLCCAFHPAARYLLDALEAVRRGYRREDMLRCLKTGYSPLNQTQQDELEIYWLENAVNGRAFLRPIENARLEDARRAFLRPLENLRQGGFARKQSVRDFCLMCFDFMERSGLKTRLNREIRRCENKGEAFRAERCAQVWEETLRILDQAVELMGQESMDPGEFLRFLRAGLENAQMMGLPQEKDAVYFGSVRRFKPGQGLKVLCVLGLNDGVLPRNVGEDSLLDENERHRLRAVAKETEISIRDLKQETALERFLIYTAFAAPKEELLLSFALSSLDGKALRPSALVQRLQALFPRLTLRGGLRLEDELWLGSVESARQQMEEGLRGLLAGNKPDEGLLRLYAGLRDHEPEALAEAVAAVGAPKEAAPLPPALAGRLYGKGRTSVSRLESFAACPYKHFVEYGLRPHILREEPLDGRDMGTAYHDAVERFVKAVSASGVGFGAITEQQTDALMDDAAAEALRDFLGRGGLEGGRGRQKLDQMRRTLRRSARTLVFQLRHSRFVPVAEEKAFGLEKGDLTLDMGNGEQISVRGRIDRVDMYKKDGETYIRVVDYKSGSAKLDLADAFYGVRLQLFVYLDAVLNMEEAKPAGVFYFKIGDPVVEMDGGGPEKALEAVEKALSLKGLVLEDMDLILAMGERDEVGRILPVSINKDSSLSKQGRSGVLSEEDFDLLRRFAHWKLRRLYEDVQSGQIAARPLAKDGEPAPCSTCPYKGVCGAESAWIRTREMQVERSEALAAMARALTEGKDAQV